MPDSSEWLQFPGWEEPHLPADHTSIQIVVNPQYIVAMQEERDAGWLRIVMAHGPSYLTEEPLEVLLARHPGRGEDRPGGGHGRPGQASATEASPPAQPKRAGSAE